MALAADPGERTQIALSLARVLLFAGQGRPAVDVLLQAERAVDGRAELAALLEAELLGAAFMNGSARRMLFERTEALLDPGDVPRGFRDQPVLLALSLSAMARNDPVDRVLALLERSGFGTSRCRITSMSGLRSG